ncbi:hypothetical protein FKM82_017649 [Ascaphus truei]
MGIKMHFPSPLPRPPPSSPNQRPIPTTSPSFLPPHTTPSCGPTALPVHLGMDPIVASGGAPPFFSSYLSPSLNPLSLAAACHFLLDNLLRPCHFLCWHSNQWHGRRFYFNILFRDSGNQRRRLANEAD